MIDPPSTPAGATPHPDPMLGFATTPEPPYVAVISTTLTKKDDDGYAAMARRMRELALRHKGCLGIEAAKNPDGFGIIVSYFDSDEALLAWRNDPEHLVAQGIGKHRWYEHYSVRIARVERFYEGPEGR